MAAPEREMAQSTGARLHSPSRQLSDEDVFSDLCTQGYAILPSYLRGTRLAALQAAAGRALPCYKYAAEGSQAAPACYRPPMRYHSCIKGEGAYPGVFTSYTLHRNICSHARGPLPSMDHLSPKNVLSDCAGEQTRV